MLNKPTQPRSMVFHAYMQAPAGASLTPAFCRVHPMSDLIECAVYLNLHT